LSEPLGELIRIRRSRPVALPRPGAKFSTREAVRRAFGGTTVRGISYLISARHVVLVSGSSSPGVKTYNYADRWLISGREYEYFGEWHGCGDMELVRGNAILVARSKRLQLVIWDGQSYVHEGPFALRSHYHRTVTNRYCKHEHSAIVFVLRRVGRQTRTHSLATT
jgi:hypothetical protein